MVQRLVADLLLIFIRCYILGCTLHVKMAMGLVVCYRKRFSMVQSFDTSLVAILLLQ